MTLDQMTIVAGAAQVLGMVGGAVWAVARIRQAGAQLQTNLKSMGRTLDRLDQTIEKLADRLNNHGERLASLEAKQRKT